MNDSQPSRAARSTSSSGGSASSFPDPFPRRTNPCRRAAQFVCVLLLVFGDGAGRAYSQNNITDLVVAQIRRAAPTSVLDMLRAVDDLANVRAYAVAQEYLQEVLVSKATDDELARVHRELGTEFFVRLIRTPAISELGSQVAKRITVAADAIARDPRRLERWVQQAQSENQELRIVARSELSNVGAEAVPTILAALAQSASATQQSRLLDALTSIGEAAIAPLIAALAADDATTAVHGANALEQISAPQAVAYLLRPVLDPNTTAELGAAASRALVRIAGGIPGRDVAAGILRREIDRLLQDPSALAEDVDHHSTVWIWDHELGSVRPRVLPQRLAALLTATWLADDLIRIAPEDRRNRWRYLGTQLAWAKSQVGLDRPLPPALRARMTANGSATDFDLVLAKALDIHHVMMAVGVLEILAETGTVESVAGGRLGNPGTLLRALHDSHPQVRMAAAAAVMQLDPIAHRAGASDLLDAVGYAAGASGQRKVLLMHPRASVTDLIAGLLNTLGFQAITTRNAKQALRMARTDPDIELILVSDQVHDPAWQELVQQFAFDVHSAGIPLCVLTTSGGLARGELFAADFDQVIAFPTPVDAETMVNLLRSALSLQATDWPTVDQRLGLAIAATGFLERLANDRVRFRDFEMDPYVPTLIGALEVPQLSETAARALGYLATPAAQSALSSFAGRAGPALSSRQAAAQALGQAVKRAGVLLSSDQILHHYQIYNASLDADEPTARILSTLLDSMETSIHRP